MLSIFDKILGALNIKITSKKRSVKAGGNISAGGDIIVANGDVAKSFNDNYYPEIVFNIVGPFRNGGVGLEIYNSGTEDVKNV